MSDMEMPDAAVAHDDRATGHELPPRLHGFSTPTPSVRPRHRTSPRGRMLIAGGALLLLAAGGTQLAASAGYDSALTAWADVSVVLDAAREATQASQATATGHSGAALRIVDGGAPLISADTLARLRDAVDRETRAAEIAAPLLADSLPEPAEKPTWAWELFTAADVTRTSTTTARILVADLEDARAELESATAVLAEHGGAALGEAAAASISIEQQNPSARPADIITLRESADAVSGAAAAFRAEAGDTFEALVVAAAQVQLSAAQELEEKAGPLLDARLAVEEYARSIAGGVLLDFDWAAIVNGQGDNGSAGGTATWNSASGGFSTITLSDSVAEMWPGDVARALVTHEVGHAIAAKCWAMFNWEDQSANEAWATAWALSMGQTADGNGVALYGYPEQSLIDTAATCR